MITKPKEKSLDDFQKEIYYSPNGCWTWTGPTHKDGYGLYKSQIAHRFSFRFYRQIDPGKLPIKHSCKNRNCVNPDHLLLMDIHNQAERRRIVQAYSMPEPNTGCWLWTEKLSLGYGHIKIEKTKYKAHRFSYDTFVGNISEGLFVCHKCDERSCVNPDHLFLGTHRDNVNDMVSKKRHAFANGVPWVKLSAAHVRIIREAWIKFGRGSQPKIAAYFKIAQSNVSAIVNRMTWNSVPK